MSTILKIRRTLSLINKIRYEICSINNTHHSYIHQDIHRYFASQGLTSDARTSEEANLFNYSIDKELHKLDMDVRKTSRISKKAVEDVFNKIKKIGSATSTQGLLLIHCCGSFIPYELASVRSELVNEIWNKLHEIGCKFDVSHFNALLKVYLENDYKFSPSEFLAKMESNGITPNKVTYQRIIARYCEDGNINGASAILEQMKHKELPINEMVFKSLIIGHSKANDMESAKSILEIMRNAKLEPTSETYTTLICCYAERGDIESIRQYIKEAERNDIFISDKDYLKIIYTLAINNHAEYIDEFTQKLHKVSGFHQDCINTILELVNRDLEDVGYKLLKLIPRPKYPDGTLLPSGNFFIHQVVKLELPIEKIIAFCKDMKKNQIHDRSLIFATGSSLVNQKTDLAIQLIQHIKEEGYPIRSHYFWPILAVYCKEKSQEAIYSTLQLMYNMSCPATFSTFNDYVFPGINMHDPDLIIQRIKEIGQTVNAIVNPLVKYYLDEGSVKKASDLVEKYPVRLDSSYITRSLAAACLNSGDMTNALKILKQMFSFPMVGSDLAIRDDCCGHFLIYLVESANIKMNFLEAVVQKMADEGLKVSPMAVENITSRLNGGSPLIIKLLEQMESQDFEVEEAFNFVHPRNMGIEELESHVIELKNKGMNTRGALRRLLMMHCRNKNINKVFEIKKQFQDEDLDISPAMYAQMVDLYVHHEKLEEALDCFKKIDSIQDFAIDSYKIVNLATLLVKNGRLDDALNILDSPVNMKRYETDYIMGNVKRLMVEVEKIGDPEATNSFINKIIERSFATTDSNILYNSLIRSYLVKEDLAGALKEFERCAQVHHCTPCNQDLFVKFITAEDAENLTKVHNICKEVHGDLNTMYDLAAGYIKCGKYREAHRIFENPNMVANKRKIDFICKHFLDLSMIPELEQFVKLTKNIYGINRDRMFQYLIQAYAKENNIEKAYDVWTEMQEENVQPSRDTLIYLSNFLKSNNQEVPFDVPNPRETPPERNARNNFMSTSEAERLLAKYETNISSRFFTFPVDHFVRLLEFHPNFEERVKQLANAYAEQENVSPMNALWIYYMKKEDFERADEIFQAHFADETNIVYQSVIKHSAETTNVTIAKKILENLKSSSGHQNMKLSAYNVLINILTRKRNFDEAALVVQDAIAAGFEVSNLNRPSLLYLKQSLIRNGKNVPFEIPSEVESKNSTSESSTS